MHEMETPRHYEYVRLALAGDHAMHGPKREEVSAIKHHIILRVAKEKKRCCVITAAIGERSPFLSCIA